MQSALYSRYRGEGDEPITARTNLYICLCTQEFDTSHLPDQVQDQVARLATSSQGARRIARSLTEGPGPTSRPGSLPAPRVASHGPPAGFGRQQRQIGIRDHVVALQTYILHNWCAYGPTVACGGPVP
jgi:hypothetical protein